MDDKTVIAHPIEVLMEAYAALYCYEQDGPLGDTITVAVFQATAALATKGMP